MSRVLCKLDKIILLCRDVQRTAGIYAEALGLKIYLQSEDFVELRDNSNMTICLQKTSRVAHLTKGYSPIISLQVENFEEVHARLLRSDLIQDGQIIRTERGRVATFLGLEGQMLSINDVQEKVVEIEDESGGSENEIRRLLQKIKL